MCWVLLTRCRSIDQKTLAKSTDAYRRNSTLMLVPACQDIYLLERRNTTIAWPSRWVRFSRDGM